MKSPAIPSLAIFVDWFQPGFKAGGPIRSVTNLALQLQGSCEVYIFTSDRDAGDLQPYPGILPNQWVEWQSGIRVWYASPDQHRAMEAEVRALKPDAVYLNSMFSVPFTILPLRWHVRKALAKRVVLAPRGMLHAGAIQYGMRKKRLFIRAMRLLGAHKRVVWQATDQQEAQDIRLHMGKASEVHLVGNIPTSDLTSTEPSIPPKQTGSARLLYVSRIQPKKNLETLLTSLERVAGKVNLDLVGPIEDEAYWHACQQHIARLPGNISVSYLGSKPHHEILDLMRHHHLFTLTTHGENFGHAIFDALLCGLPVLLSDQTPWNHVTVARAGWAIPLIQPDSFTTAIQTVVDWDYQQFAAWCGNARRLALDYLNQGQFKSDYLHLFFATQPA